jgi:hypothetical protein
MQITALQTFFRIDGLMRPMKSTNAEMDNANCYLGSIIGWLTDR